MTNQKPKIEYDWNSWKAEIKFQGKEKLSGDKLKRKEYAAFLTEYLNKAGDRKGGYVMNLNAEWGAGKTWFLKRWCETLRPFHPVAYIDAWKNDFSKEPLMTVISGILESLKLDSNNQVNEDRARWADKFWQGTKKAAPALISGLVNRYIGVDLNEILGADEGQDAFGTALQNLVDNHSATEKGLDEFKETISDWLEEATKEDSMSGWRTPMYVFIDELDRCRPTYAIELLETVKHLFELQNIVFVIATNTDQLQHSIKAVYGEGFDASRYLYRFFNRSFSLEQPALADFISSAPVSDDLWKVLEKTHSDKLWFAEQKQMDDFFGRLAEAFSFDLRTTLQWLDQCLAAFLASENVLENYRWPYLVAMIGLQLSNPALFDALFVNRKLSTDRIRDNSTTFSHRIQDEFQDYRDVMDSKAGDSMMVSVGFCTSRDLELELPAGSGVPEVSNVHFNFSFTKLIRISEQFSQGFKAVQPPKISGVQDKHDVGYELLFDKAILEKKDDRAAYVSLINMAFELR